MASAEISITVDRPINEVFDYVVEIERLPEWVPVIQDAWPTSSDQARVGATYLVKANFMGKVMEIPSEIVGYERNRLYAYRSSGSMAYVDTMLFEETKAGTRVTERIVMESDGRFSRLWDAIKLGISKRSHQKNLELLKERLEGSEVAVVA